MAVPLNVTEVAAVKFSPRMLTLVPAGPPVGVNELIDGGRGTEKQQLETVPFGVVPEIGPVRLEREPKPQPARA